ncbi:MAG: hypothetical protein MZV63_05075 [Marinilabiliales bacterium]|nr:hypothetical protein [Marinilabiliales bacterium]
MHWLRCNAYRTATKAPSRSLTARSGWYQSLMCDGLGACIGHCPEDAITIEKREAQPYDEITVISEMVHKGANTVTAHLKHLKDHREFDYLKEGSGMAKGK